LKEIKTKKWLNFNGGCILERVARRRGAKTPKKAPGKKEIHLQGKEVWGTRRRDPRGRELASF